MVNEKQQIAQNDSVNNQSSVTADLLREIESTDERVPVKDEQPSYLEKLQQIAFQWFYFIFLPQNIFIILILIHYNHFQSERKWVLEQKRLETDLHMMDQQLSQFMVDKSLSKY